jgi:hypothetical protein
MSSQLYIITGLAFALLSGFCFQREKRAVAGACAVVSSILILLGPAIASLP